MAIQLFRAGAGTTRNGIECEVGTFDEYSYLHLLKEGWHYTPEECYAEEKPTDSEEANTEAPEPEAESKEDDETPVLEGDIRDAAKDAGISHWWTKSIPRLMEELQGE